MIHRKVRSIGQRRGCYSYPTVRTECTYASVRTAVQLLWCWDCVWLSSCFVVCLGERQTLPIATMLSSVVRRVAKPVVVRTGARPSSCICAAFCCSCTSEKWCRMKRKKAHSGDAATAERIGTVRFAFSLRNRAKMDALGEKPCVCREASDGVIFP